MKSLFEIEDYKAWIKLRIKTLPHGGRGELSRIASHLRVHATLVSQVLKANKDFTIEQGYSLTEYFGLTELESEFFINLIQINRAGSHGLKKFFGKRLKELKRKSQDLQRRLPIDRQLTLEESANFYSSWVYSAVRVYSSIGSGKTFDEIRKHFNLSVGSAIHILSSLVDYGLCAKKDDLYMVGPRATHVAFPSPFLKSHLTNWRIKALESAANIQQEELMYSACLSLSKKDFETVRESMAELLKQIQLRVQQTEPEEIVIFNLDWCFLRP